VFSFLRSLFGFPASTPLYPYWLRHLNPEYLDGITSLHILPVGTSQSCAVLNAPSRAGGGTGMTLWDFRKHPLHGRDDFLAAGEVALTHVKNKADGRNWRITELKKELAEREKTSYATCLKLITGTDNKPHNFSKSQSDRFFENGHFEIKYQAATASTTKLNT